MKIENMTDILSMLKGADPESVLLQDSEAGYTIAELTERCYQLAMYLAQHGIQSLGLHADNGVDWVVADLTCQREGIMLIPVPTFFSDSQVTHLLKQCALDAILTDKPGNLPSLAGMDVDAVGWLPDSSLFLFVLDSPESKPAMPEGTSKITFTSGSTGSPKGVCLSKQQQLAQASILRDCVDLDSPRHLCVLPLSTLLENIAGVYAPLLAGGTVLLPSLEELGFHGSEMRHPARLILTITRFEPESLILVPQLLMVLVAAVQQGWSPPKSLKFIAVGGSKVSAELLLAASAQDLPVYEGYGLSECCSVVALNTPNAGKAGSCGAPLPNLNVELRDGEILVRGNSMLGYMNEPESWNQSEIATGDVGYLDAQGYLHVNGRRKNVIISSFGRNISPEWVESELLANPKLAEAVLVGDSRPYCGALISLRDPSMSLGEVEKWIDAVNSKLPDYARVRRFVLLETPLSARSALYTANGRPRREAINHAMFDQIESMYEGGLVVDYA